jgi:hypothetical protein
MEGADGPSCAKLEPAANNSHAIIASRLQRILMLANLQEDAAQGALSLPDRNF